MIVSKNSRRNHLFLHLYLLHKSFPNKLDWNNIRIQKLGYDTTLEADISSLGLHAYFKIRDIDIW